MAVVSIADAARLAAKDRRTIERHLKSGILSYTIDATGRRVIDTSELLRVYGSLQNADREEGTVQMDPITDSRAVPPLDDGEKVALRAHIVTLERHLEELREEKRELRAQVVGLLEYRRSYSSAAESQKVQAPAEQQSVSAKDTAADKASRIDLIYLFVGIVSVILAVVLLWAEGFRPWFML